MKRGQRPDTVVWRDGARVSYQTLAPRRSNAWRRVLHGVVHGVVVLAQAIGLLLVLYLATVAMMVL